MASSTATAAGMSGVTIFAVDPLAAASTIRASPVPNTDRPLPIECPKCQHVRSKLRVTSLTVMTVTCASGGHTWSADLPSLPLDIQDAVRELDLSR
jgi:hypothetical protein